MTTLSDCEDQFFENEITKGHLFSSNDWLPSDRVYPEELLSMKGSNHTLETIEYVIQT